MYQLTLQGSLVKLQVINPQLSHSNLLSDLLNTYYDDEDAVILPYGTRGYEHPGDALRAFVRACDRRHEHLSAITRGRVKEFSKRSRHRLLQLIARLSEGVNGVLVTFTYKRNMQDHELSKQHLDFVLRYLKYHYPRAAALWRMDHQQRGAIHYHVMLLSHQNVWLDVNALRAYWRALAGEVANIDVKWIASRRRAVSYGARYLAKVSDAAPEAAPDAPEATPDASDEASLDHVPYSENSTRTDAAKQFVGRFWGVFNRGALPLAPAHVFAWGETLVKGYIDLTRAVASWAKSRMRLALCEGNRRQAGFYRWLCHHVKRSHRRAGFTLFTDAGGWLRWCCTAGIPYSSANNL